MHTLANHTDLGTFDADVLSSRIQNAQDWGSYPNGSPAQGMQCKRLTDTFYVERELSRWYHIESVKWAKLHNLRPGQEIKPHSDPADGREDVHVVHFVLQTNDKVVFNIDGTDYPFLKGHAYEIVNTVPHYVQNNGDDERIHLMVIFYGTRKPIDDTIK